MYIDYIAIRLKNVQRLDQRNEAITDIEVQADLLTEETKSFAENAKKLKEQARARNFKYTIFLVIRGYSMTTWTQFCPFLTTTYFYVDIFNP